MQDLLTPQTEQFSETIETSPLERGTLRVLRRIPGLQDQVPTRRVLRVLRGGAWTVFGYGTSQILRLVAQLVLAHLLLPSAFGLVALASVFLSGLEMLSDLGIGLDVIQHPRGDEPDFINTAFLIQVMRGTVIFILAAALAYPFSAFYHQPAVRWLAIVAALSTLLRGFSSGSIWTMTRHVELKKLTMLNIASDATGMIVSLVWVAFSPTAWALVIGRVASAAALVLGSHLVADYRPSLKWDKRAATDIFLFGTGIFLSTATYFLSGEAERLIVAKFITVAELGCFSLALTLSAVPAQAINQLVGQVFFPVIAESIREDQATALKHYRKTRNVFLVISTLIGVAAVAYGPRAVSILLPSKFAMTGWMLQLLGWRAAQQIFSAPTSTYVLACGDSKPPAISNFVRLVLMVGGLAIAFTKFGLHEAVAVLSFAGAVAYAVVLIPAFGRRLRPAVWGEVSAFALFVGVTAIAAILPWPWR